MLMAIQCRSIFGGVRFATYGPEISRRHFVQLAAIPASRWIAPFAGSYYLLYGIYLETGVGFRASAGVD